MKPRVVPSTCAAFYGWRTNARRDVRVGSFMRGIPSLRIIGMDLPSSLGADQHMMAGRPPPRKGSDVVVENLFPWPRRGLGGLQQPVDESPVPPKATSAV